MKMRFYSDKDETHELMISCIVGFLYVEKNNPGYVKMELLVNYCSFSRLITVLQNTTMCYYNSRQLGLEQFTTTCYYNSR